MPAVVGARVVTGWREIPHGTLVWEGERIERVDADPPGEGVEIIDGRGKTLVPGFIDLHVHGGDGGYFGSEEEGAVAKAADFHLRYGTTGLMATVGGGVNTLADRLQMLRGLAQETPRNVLGVHLEGPFLNPVRKGAIPPHTMLAPSVEALDQLAQAGGGLIRMISLAPELPGALELIRAARKLGIVVAAGHTDGTYEEFQAGVLAGVTHLCHGFNAMRSIHHREPGLITGALLAPGVTIEVICDGIHLHPAIVEMVYRLKGADGMTMITDAIRAAGLPEGVYGEKTGVERRVSGGAVRLPDGTLAGSLLTMNKGLQLLREKVGMSWPEATRAASLTPARVLGLAGERGSLEVGKRADWVLLDDEFNVSAVCLAGNLVKGVRK